MLIISVGFSWWPHLTAVFLIRVLNAWMHHVRGNCFLFAFLLKIQSCLKWITHQISLFWFNAQLERQCSTSFAFIILLTQHNVKNQFVLHCTELKNHKMEVIKHNIPYFFLPLVSLKCQTVFLHICGKEKRSHLKSGRKEIAKMSFFFFLCLCGGTFRERLWPTVNCAQSCSVWFAIWLVILGAHFEPRYSSSAVQLQRWTTIFDFTTSKWTFANICSNMIIVNILFEGFLHNITNNISTFTTI